MRSEIASLLTEKTSVYDNVLTVRTFLLVSLHSKLQVINFYIYNSNNVSYPLLELSVTPRNTFDLSPLSDTLYLVTHIIFVCTLRFSLV